MIDSLPKISYEIPHDAGSVTVAPHDSDESSDSQTSDSIKNILLTLNDQLHSHRRFLMIGLDEIQESSADDLLRIIRVVHKTAGTDRPILFFGAGLPNSGTVLRAVRTYTEKWAYFRLELLSISATYEVVDRPARQLNVRWQEDAIEEIYRRSHYIARHRKRFLERSKFAPW